MASVHQSWTIADDIASKFEGELNKYRGNEKKHLFRRHSGNGPGSPTKRRLKGLLKKLGAGNDNKKVLFECPHAKISVYDAGHHSHGGSVVAHGSFQVYQLRNSMSNYLACGKTVHPVMQALKVYRINENSFVLPMYNPDRYWKLTVDSDPDRLGGVLAEIARYNDLRMGGIDEIVGDIDGLSRVSSVASEMSTVTGSDGALDLNQASLELVPSLPAPLEDVTPFNSAELKRMDVQLGESDRERSDPDETRVASSGSEKSTVSEDCDKTLAEPVGVGSEHEETEEEHEHEHEETESTKVIKPEVSLSAAPTPSDEEVTLLQPTPIRPGSTSSIDSILSRFEGSHLTEIKEHPEPTVPSWMDPESMQSRNRSINKRFSLTYKAIKPIAAPTVQGIQRQDLTGRGSEEKRWSLFGW